MLGITILVSNLILVGLQFMHEIFLHHFKELSLCFQGIPVEFIEFKDSSINLYVCILCRILALRYHYIDSLLFFFLHLSLKCSCYPLQIFIITNNIDFLL